MADPIFTDMMKKQTELAWQYIEKAKPLITYEKLVPVPKEQIAQYELTKNKIIPPDFRYWLTTYGSGRIEFVEGGLAIASIYELKALDDRPVSEDDPQNCWKRIGIHYPITNIAYTLDSTIIENGCAPIIDTIKDTNKVEKVLASSWPMYVIKSIIDIATGLKKHIQTGLYTPEQVYAIEALTGENFEFIDIALESASKRAQAHNGTRNENLDDTPGGNPEMLLSMVDLLEECMKHRKPSGFTSKLKSLFADIWGDDEFTKAVKEIDGKIENGYASLADSSYSLTDKVEPKHAKGIAALLNHERRELRELAHEGWLRINPTEAEKLAERMWDWRACAESWLKVDKSGKEAARCMREAEKVTTDFIEWRACADFWRDEIHDGLEAHRCLVQAEINVANSDFPLPSNLIQLASAWIKEHDLERARESLLRFEVAAKGNDYNTAIWAAQYWRNDLQDIESAKRCLWLAETLVPDHHPYALRSVLSEWESLGDVDGIEKFKSRNAEYMRG